MVKTKKKMFKTVPISSMMKFWIKVEKIVYSTKDQMNTLIIKKI